MKTIFKYVLLAMAVINPPGVGEANASETEIDKICALQRVWVPPGESDKGYRYSGYWMQVRICEASAVSGQSDREEEKEDQT